MKPRNIFAIKCKPSRSLVERYTAERETRRRSPKICMKRRGSGEKSKNGCFECPAPLHRTDTERGTLSPKRAETDGERREAPKGAREHDGWGIFSTKKKTRSKRLIFAYFSKKNTETERGNVKRDLPHSVYEQIHGAGDRQKGASAPLKNLSRSGKTL